MSTRAAQATALAHVLDNVFQVGPNHPLRAFLASEDVDLIFDLIRYDELQLMETTFPGTNGNDRKLSMTTVNKLMDLRAWFLQQDNHTPSVFMALTADDFDTFCTPTAEPTTPTNSPAAAAFRPTSIPSLRS